MKSMRFKMSVLVASGLVMAQATACTAIQSFTDAIQQIIGGVTGA